ncbi:substrate-binding domain-containing protein [uncultured Roseobacter sp.]|nr:substrate-binding domain-containing protein [uncultured Roseobacter sp.]
MLGVNTSHMPHSIGDNETPDMTRRSLMQAALATTFFAGLPACSGREKLNISTATTAAPLFMALAPAFEQANPGVSVTIVAGGSAVAILDVASGHAHAGAAAREPTENELRRVLFIPMAIDQIAIVAHETFARENVTTNELRALSSGLRVEGFEDVTFIGKAAAHGTYQSFQDGIGMSGEPLSSDAVGGSNGEVLNLISATRGIGYVSVADAERAIASGEPLKILAVDDLSTGTSSERNADYPLTRTLFCLLPRQGLEMAPSTTPLARDFLNLLQSPEGHQAIREAGFTPAS